jgi:hypothetical protein
MISKARILQAAVDAIEADGKYLSLSGAELRDAKEETKVGIAYIVDAIIDELVSNAELSGATAGTDGLPVVTAAVVGDATVNGGLS